MLRAAAPLAPPPPRSYLAWSAAATALAALTGFLIPWEVAFLPPEELYRLGSPWAVLNLALVAAFGLDMLASFRLVSAPDGSQRRWPVAPLTCSVSVALCSMRAP